MVKKLISTRISKETVEQLSAMADVGTQAEIISRAVDQLYRQRAALALAVERKEPIMAIIPDFQMIGVDPQTETDVRAILYGIALIRKETGYGVLTLEIAPAAITNMTAEHKIKPKFLQPAES